MAKLPDNPNTRMERYLARLAGQDVSIPDTPITRIECYLAYLIENGGGAVAPTAGAHNSTFRGKNLGSSFTDAQADAIAAGTFEGIFIGDYWRMGNFTYRVAGFDIFYNMEGGNTRHHAVIVPDNPMLQATMKSTGDTTGGYALTDMRSVTLPALLETIEGHFSADRVLTISKRINSRVDANGVPDSWSTVSTKLELLTESMVVGRGLWGTQVQNAFNVGSQYSQLPLFALEPRYIRFSTGSYYWLQDVRNLASFSEMARQGYPNAGAPNSQAGVRPYFCIGKAS